MDIEDIEVGLEVEIVPDQDIVNYLRVKWKQGNRFSLWGAPEVSKKDVNSFVNSILNLTFTVVYVSDISIGFPIQISPDDSGDYCMSVAPHEVVVARRVSMSGFPLLSL